MKYASIGSDLRSIDFVIIKEINIRFVRVYREDKQTNTATQLLAVTDWKKKKWDEETGGVDYYYMQKRRYKSRNVIIY